MVKMTLGEEIREVKLENISILQKLQRKPSEDVYYHWSYSEDCSFMRRAILHRGQFSSDISWLLVASIWKGLGFDVKTVQNKMVYQLLDSDHDMCPPSSLNNIVEKYVKDVWLLIATQEHSEIASALNLLDAALALSPRLESGLELKAQPLLYLRRFKEVADMLQEYIPSYKMVYEESSLSSDNSSQQPMESIITPHTGH
uniref:Uncharacterized protein n=1 Tax=Nelumbo nucifera TaxID=4432 RepID=A0A822YC30_NELNU|nr:TPA_asm: hypothetical protein HUJ06_030317 [Nelumbo nucifera]